MHNHLENYEDVYHRNFSELDEGLESLMEKMVILTHLYSREFQLFTAYGQADTLKASLWGGRFSDQDSDLAAMFNKANEPYREELQ